MEPAVREAMPASPPPVFSIYGTAINIFHRVGILPFKWDPKQCALVAVKRNCLWLALVYCLILSQAIFINFQATRFWFIAEKAPMLKKLFFTIQSGLLGINGANFAVMYHDPPLIAALVNNVLRVSRICGSPRGRQVEIGSKKVLYVILFFCTFVPIYLGRAFLVNPANPRSFLSLLHEPSAVSKAVRITVGLVQSYSVALVTINLWFALATVGVLLPTLISIIRGLRCQTVTKFIRVTDRISILLVWFNEIFGPLICVWEFTFVAVLIIDVTVAVLAESVRAFLMAASVSVMMVHLYTKMGRVYQEAEGIVKDVLVYSKRDPWLRARCRAYRTWRVYLGPFSFVDRGLVLTMLTVALQSTANLIIALDFQSKVEE